MLQSILIDIDALLDTRLSLINLINPDLAKSYVENPKNFAKYANRIQDEFEELGLVKGNFRSLYRERTSHLLPLSMATSLTYELKNIVAELLRAQIDSPHRVTGIEIDINTYPYKDIPEEVLNWIIDAVEQHTGFLVSVKTVYYTLLELSPSFLKKSKYVSMYIYDFDDWFRFHYNDKTAVLEDYRLPAFSIITPLIVANIEDLRKAVEFETPNGERCDIRDALRVFFADFFKFEVTDIGLFSIANPGLIAYHQSLIAKKDDINF